MVEVDLVGVCGLEDLALPGVVVNAAFSAEGVEGVDYDDLPVARALYLDLFDGFIHDAHVADAFVRDDEGEAGKAPHARSHLALVDRAGHAFAAFHARPFGFDGVPGGPESLRVLRQEVRRPWVVVVVGVIGRVELVGDEVVLVAFVFFVLVVELLWWGGAVLALVVFGA